MSKKCAAVIVAAGSAQRMQGIDKMLAQLRGVPVLLRSVRALAQSERIGEIYIVTREDRIQQVQALCASEPKLKKVLSGGESRAESVLRGIEVVDGESELVAIHDGARPLVTQAVIEEVIEAAELFSAAAPAVAVHDTIKTAKNGIVLQTPERSSLFAVQTPQVFERKLLLSSLKEAIERQIPLTDDCSAVEVMGKPVRLTRGSTENLKITVPLDLIMAEAILKEREDL